MADQIGDSVGWPTEAECLAVVEQTSPDGLTDVVVRDVPKLIEAVKAHFQSPIGPNGTGGTGRNFNPGAPETRTYDGNGMPELRVDDIVPGTVTAITMYGATLSDAKLKDPPHRGMPANVIYRPQNAGMILGAGYGLSGLFMIGKQNIAVTAVFAYAARVPVDVWDAVRQEVCYRSLVQGAVGIEGIGFTLSMGPFSMNTAAGVSAWQNSSPIPVLHGNYERTVRAYREKNTWQMARLSKRMS